MPRTRISSAAAYAACAALVWAVTASTAAHAEALVKARLAQNLAPISGLTIVAKSKRFFEKQGLDITVTNFTSGKQCLDTVIGGGADIATTAEAPVTAAAMANQPIAFVAGMEYSDLKTVTATKAGIKTKADLRGKKNGLHRRHRQRGLHRDAAEGCRAEAERRDACDLRPQEMLPAMAAGSIDAFDTWEPHIANARKTLGESAALLDTRGTYSETFNIVVTRPYLDANGPIVEKFLRALLQAEAWVKSNPDDAITTIADAIGMKREDLAAIWNDYVYHVRIDDQLLGILELHAAWRLASGNHPPGATMPDFAKVLELKPLRSIDPGRVTVSIK